MTAILHPIGKIEAPAPIRPSNTYRKGMTKTLAAISVGAIPFMPNLMAGKNESQQKMIELVGIKDHVKPL
jgi:hypothetical protein